MAEQTQTSVATRNMENYFVTPWFRGNHPVLDRAESFEGSRPSRSIIALWTPDQFSEEDQKYWQNIGAVCDRICRETFRKSLNDCLVDRNFKFPIRDGMEKEDQEGYGQGVKFARLKTYGVPKVFYPNKREFDLSIASEYEKHVYAGRLYRAVLKAYPFDNKGRGVGFSLDTLQIGPDAERFSGISGGQGADLLGAVELPAGSEAEGIVNAVEGGRGSEDLGF